MKVLFFFLLLINIAHFVWIYPQSSGPEPQFAQPTGSESLLLLSEFEEVVIDASEGDEAVVETKGPAEPESEIASSDDEEVVLSETLPDEGVVEERVSETEFPTPIDIAETEGESSASIPDLVPLVHCGRMGPLGKRAQADQLSLRLRALGLQPELNSELSNNQEGYWVLVPPQKNRTAAVRIVKRLQDEGIADLWRFTSGKLAHAISLGLFRNKTRAEIRRKSIADKGFEVEVRPRYRQKTHYWLSYSYSGESPLKDNKWEELTGLHPGIEQQEVDCLEIATP